MTITQIITDFSLIYYIVKILRYFPVYIFSVFFVCCTMEFGGLRRTEDTLTKSHIVFRAMTFSETSVNPTICNSKNCFADS